VRNPPGGRKHDSAYIMSLTEEQDQHLDFSFTTYAPACQCSAQAGIGGRPPSPFCSPSRTSVVSAPNLSGTNVLRLGLRSAQFGSVRGATDHLGVAFLCLSRGYISCAKKDASRALNFLAPKVKSVRGIECAQPGTSPSERLHRLAKREFE
jgi:hypothetical protein